MEFPETFKDISIHAPTRGATLQMIFRIPIFIFQSTLLQEERLFDGVGGFFELDISIHAPTRGATVNTILLNCGEFISIHAPTRGATTKSLCGWLSSYYFNPRSYKRSDRVVTK